MSEDKPKRLDEATLRAHLETAIADHAQEFETFFLARFLDLSFSYLPEDAPDAEKDVCRITFPVTDLVRNPQGSLHGGAMATVMDISMGHLVKKVAGPGATIEIKVQYMRPVVSGIATCEGRFLRRGRQLSFMESQIFDADGKLAAHATATWKMP